MDVVDERVRPNRPNEDATLKNHAKKFIRYTIVIPFGILLVCLGASFLQNSGSTKEFDDSSDSRTLLLSLSMLLKKSNLHDDPIWTASSISAVKRMFKDNTGLLKQWVKLSGNEGKVLLASAKTKPRLHRFSNLDKDLQQLDSSIGQLSSDASDTSKDVGSDSTWLPHVNSRAAFLMVNDLSKDWDAHTNYSSTPWEFCVGRDLSTRQIRECAEHLIAAAGVKAHRDLELDSKVHSEGRDIEGHSFLV